MAADDDGLMSIGMDTVRSGGFVMLVLDVRYARTEPAMDDNRTSFNVLLGSQK